MRFKYMDSKGMFVSPIKAREFARNNGIAMTMPGTFRQKSPTHSRHIDQACGVQAIPQEISIKLLSNITKKRRALLIGVNSQDGSYLAELLLERGYEVLGLVRRTGNGCVDNIRHILSHIHVERADLSDTASLWNQIKVFQPNEVYNLASISHVYRSVEQPDCPFDIPANKAIMFVIRLLEGIRASNANSKFYQDSSGEMFGDVAPPQNEETQFNPRSPYAIAKLAGYHITRLYRCTYKIFACNGILFDHESPRQGEDVIARKIVRHVVEIKLGRRTFIEVGNLDARRDWGYAKEYVDAMWRIMQHYTAEDFVIGTGETYSVKEFLEEVLSRCGLTSDCVRTSEKLLRSSGTCALRVDSSKARTVLGWEPKVKFRDLVDLMVEEELKRYK